jgi:hypothetical protein
MDRMPKIVNAAKECAAKCEQTIELDTKQYTLTQNNRV